MTIFMDQKVSLGIYHGPVFALPQLFLGSPIETENRSKSHPVPLRFILGI